ncbi:MAG: ATP-binding cassette domain-containing protein, partial [Deltaproteobacteria bacterium]|nr:ATP-binding cassette domain-containing protein [Deltaproteobacteria bacterium]
MIAIERLRKSYGKTLALSDLSLEVAKGELFAFLGPNGAGKTTTIRVLTGLSRFDSGKVSINGVDILKHPLEAKRLCGLVTQHVNLDGDLSCRENLEIHGRLFGMPRKARQRAAEEQLDKFELADRAQSLVKTLSGGLKRRLMIARSLIHSPSLIFMDEPTVGLDPAIRRRIWSLIKRISQGGVTVFLTTHYIEEAEFLADQVAFIDKGALVEKDTPQAVMARLGQWAVDIHDGEEPKTRFFEDRAEAG